MTTPRLRTRRTAVVLLTTGLTCLAGAGLPLLASAHADGEPGSGFGSFTLSANAPVGVVREDLPSQQCSAPPTLAGSAACEGVINESVSTLRNGPIGHALSSVVWPGTLGGNAGSLLLVVGSGGIPVPVPIPVPITLPSLPPVPPQASMLNDPIKAENTTSGAQDTVVNSPVPGTTMTATATAAHVAATSTIGASQTAAVGSVATINSSSHVTLTGPKTAEAVAHSEVTDLTIAGVIHIGAITSDATATTDGTTATTSGRTTVTGVTIANVPVTIDHNGVTVQAQNVPVPAAATAAVNTALSQAGITLSLSTASGQKSGAGATFDAGSLVIGIKQPASLGPVPTGPGYLTIELGGANVAVDATPGYDFTFPTVTVPYTGGTTGGAVPPSVSGPAPLTSGTSGVPAVGGTVPPPAVGNPPVTTSPVLAAYKLPHGLSPGLVALALVGAGLVMAGLRRLPDRVLVAPAGACTEGDLA